ncbi:MAG: nicotinamide-nucleotide amidohydrolase family protein [Mycoplasmataceae bacterium]|nr:nicotinamide-nucleotide amidohydrolase family protein [Mycoplasmataceae bacterium]
MNELFLLLNKHNLTIATAESITGGSFASEITKLPNASKVFKGCIVSYSNESKQKILKVKTKNGVINQQTATQMAIKVRNIFNVDFGISFTGNAGPISMEDRPVGLTYLAISFNHQLFEFEFQAKSEKRIEIIAETIIFSIEELKKIIKNHYL